jgi:RND family efflux transporter MFP subunit
MTTPADRAALWTRVPRTVFVAAGAIAALVLLLLYLQGSLGGHKVPPGVVPLPAAGTPANTVRVEQREVDDLVDWPGTVTSRLVANLAPKVMARVLEVRVTAGTAVRQGDVLATLDDRELRARAQQAAAAVTAAEAQVTQAEADLRRARTLFERQAGTQQDLDAAETRAKSARAAAAQSRDALNEVQVLLGETTVRAPFDGVVASRLVDPGDMAVPGKPVVIVHDPESLRVEAHLSERCTRRLAIGTPVSVQFGTPPTDLSTAIDEIAPIADPQSRTLLIKAALPPRADVRPGTFATVRVPCGNHVALLIPPSAVRRTGQLENVRVIVDGEPRTRDVRTGKTYGDRVEVLSGLAAGELVVVEP